MRVKWTRGRTRSTDAFWKQAVVTQETSGDLPLNQTEPEDAHSPEEASPDGDAARREFIRKGGKLLVYSAPFVQLFRPSVALAATGDSLITV